MKLIILIMAMMSGLAQASLVRGNGGNTVVCPVAVEVLDIYEARVLEQWSFNSEEKENRAMERAQRWMSAAEFEKMSSWLSSFDSEVQWVSESKLGEVKDSFHFVIPKECSIEQTVLARNPLPGEKRYLVRKEIYKRLPSWQQNALKWHEVIYRRIIERRNSYNSESTRKIVAALFADDTETLTANDWAELLKDLN